MITHIAIFTSLLLVTLSLTGCSDTRHQQLQTLVSKFEARSDQLAEWKQDTVLAQPPFAVVVLSDFSQSIENAQIEPVRSQSLQRLGDAIAHTGGEFAYGQICTTSKAPFERITLSEPHLNQAFKLTPPILPLPPSEETPNRFAQRDEISTYFDAIAEMEPRIKGFLDQIEFLETQSVKDLQFNQSAAKRFIDEAMMSTINAPKTCSSTDLQTIVSRTNEIFAEVSDFTQPPYRIAVIISDGLDSYSSLKANLEVDELVLIRGVGDGGIFAALPQKRFESPNVAFDNISRFILGQHQNWSIAKQQ